MTTPVVDFVNNYASSGTARFHMPGHKGRTFLGPERLDITEIRGADELYEADGILAESEQNATSLFGSGRTVYSTEGSSLGVKTMLSLVCGFAVRNHPERKPLILAARNVHKSFVYASALLGFDVRWIFPEQGTSLLSCLVSGEMLTRRLSELRTEGLVPDAVYVTSPDYLGSIQDIGELSRVCRCQGILLAVDNAHGAYLHFLQKPCHPLDLGADLCCDSAHKTLPVLTGGAYVHVRKGLPPYFENSMKRAMEPFASTSPSYLVLQSLDLCNAYLSGPYREKLSGFLQKLNRVREEIKEMGFQLQPSDPLRLTVRSGTFREKPRTCDDISCGAEAGNPLPDLLRRFGIECEYSDRDYTVLMTTPENSEDLERLIDAFRRIAAFSSGEYQADDLESALPGKPAEYASSWSAPGSAGARTVHSKTVCKGADTGTMQSKSGDLGCLRSVRGGWFPSAAESVLSAREALLLPSETIPVSKALGRISAMPVTACPPAVPIACAGERISQEMVDCFCYYGYQETEVILERNDP